MNTTLILLAVLGLWNLATFYSMYRDKQLSRRGGDTDRTPEGLLFFLATAFGSLGIYVGMYLFRHKTRKWYFQIGIPLLILQNAVTVHFFAQFLM